MTPRERKAARLQREADALNAAHPVGTRVRYWSRPAIPLNDPPTGESVVLQPAVAKRDHVSVAVGWFGALSIARVEALTVPLRKPRRERVSSRCTCGAPAMEGGVGMCGACTFGEASMAEGGAS